MLPEYSCIDCGTPVWKEGKRCKPCHGRTQRKERKPLGAGDYKVCSDCGENKEATEFTPITKTSDGRKNFCRPCGQVRAKKNRCATCGVPTQGKHCKPCGDKARMGENHWAWQGGRKALGDGYMVVYAPDHPRSNKNYVLEHRYVMEQHLGRYLLPEENVHHINGIKDDNRLENLELWNYTQPCGQRAEDKLAFAYEIIALYGPDELKEIISKL